ncbi:MAG: hypothetical protein CMO66_01595 [Verrucomicrobiales bacterium]|nr:hypothetical protein [Verrucomicrobiales bacterium]
MEALIMAIGVKACCIGSATIGGAANWAINRAIKWVDLAVAIGVGWVSAELFLPPIMMHFMLDVTWGPALSFLIGFSAIRLLPVIEQRIKSFIEKS